jgi:single-stranded DNA-binding protein
MNQVTIIGFTCKDAESHSTPNSTLVTTLSVATKESWNDADGQWKAAPTCIGSSASAGLAEYSRTLP